MFHPMNEILTRIKANNPLILNLTNPVSINLVANGLLSIGASPIMTHALEELEPLMQIANALVINLGTLNEAFIKLCHEACRLANHLAKPIILDPVGAGASSYRTQNSLDLLERFDGSIIRGNASEIMALAGESHSTKGVESTTTTQYAIHSAQALAAKYQLTVVISGQMDAIVSTDKVQLFERGSPLMPKITGSGCLLTAVNAAFHAVHPNSFEASCAAVLFYGVCGELAAQKAAGPGSFSVHFLDTLSLLPQFNDY